MVETLVECEQLTKIFSAAGGMLSRKAALGIKAVDRINLTIHRGETLGLVGESGCGKSTMGRLIMGLLPATEGAIRFAGTDITRLNEVQLRKMRSRFQMIFQDPFGSLNPRMRVHRLVSEPLKIQGLAKGVELRDSAAELLEAVGLGSRYLDRFPHEFSGGQKQRIGIARAMALNPELIVADEPVSALDVSVQAQVINLMQDLQKARGLTYLFISHDLSVVHHIADRVAVMYLGQIVESATRERLFDRPSHPYTQALLSAIPVSRPQYRRKKQVVSGDLPSPQTQISGCKFVTRCPFASECCWIEEPTLQPLETGHLAACHNIETVLATDPIAEVHS